MNDRFATRSPIDGSALSPVSATPSDALPQLVDNARQAQQAWAALSCYERANKILGVKQKLLERAEEIAELVHREVGKPVEEAALAEVLPNADLVDYWCAAIEELLEPMPVELDALSYPSKSGHTQRDARGVLALITPWNYPIAIPLRTIVPALLCGNAVLFKPSEVTPRCGELVTSLFAELLPKDVLTLVQGDGEVGAKLVDSDVDAVVFTGSVETGRTIATACAQRLIPCSLELGGKDAAIVRADCNLERAANGIVWGAFTNAGQNCAAIERVYVESTIADKFIERVTALTKKLRPGVDTAMMTTLAQKQIAQRHLDEAVAEGATVLHGADDDTSDDGHSFTPTVVRIEAEQDDCSVMQDETFGPLLPIRVVDDVAQAVTLVNASRYALTTSIWSKDTHAAEALVSQLNSGVVTINNHGFTAALPEAPWSGTGASGFGVTNSPHSLGAFTRPRFVLVDHSRGKTELWWYPYTPALRAIAFAMAKVRGGAGFFGRIRAIATLIAAFPKRLFGG